MNKISSDVVDRLIQYSGEPALTLYIPTHEAPTPPNLTENQTRYKNMVRDGLRQWHEAGGSDTSAVQKQLDSILDDSEFWQRTSRSIAIFVTQSDVELYMLPIEVNEQIYVGETFDVLPLLQVKTMNQPFYLFALAMHEPKLFKGDMYGLELVDVAFPVSPEAALNIDEMYSGSNTVRAGSGSMQGSPHGQGDSQQAGQEERLMYFRMLEGLIVKEKAIDTELPFVIAATDSEAADYRALSKLHITEAHISGNRTKDNLGELHPMAYEIIKTEVIASRMKDIAEQYERAVGAQKATVDMGDITEAAEAGRVDRLLLSPFEQTSDSVSDASDASTLALPVDVEQKASLPSLVMNVIRNGGSIEIFNSYLMPKQAKVAALFRY